MEEIIIKVKGKEYKVRVEEKGGKVKVYCGNDVYEIDSKSEIEPLFADIIKEEENEKGQIAVKAPLPGVIFSVNAKAGDKVKKGAVLVKLMAMKMENDVAAAKDCIVREIKVKKNDTVNRGDTLAILE
ncbi:biotin/lipoyl-binding protein [Candidatus Woesearchaeota archaeon]|nr:biotin/lipoyl-binding protein [Candidatus Woesearchaeota archaeon]